jgi:hypothetical protein
MARASKTAYLDRDGKLIQPSKWKTLREDKTYCTLAEYENDRFRVVAEWVGSIADASNIPRADWKPCALEVFVVQRSDIDGRELPEPVLKRDTLACERYRTGEEAMNAAVAFLKRYAKVSDAELEEMKPLSDAVSSKAEHIPTREEASSTQGCW